MAKIAYNGMELEEITTPQIFDPPKKCVVWDDYYLSPCEKDVIAIFPDSAKLKMKVIDTALYRYKHCALLPDPPKPRRATNRELSRWLAEGKGEFTNPKPEFYSNYSSFAYEECDKDKEVYASFKIRKWSDEEWHEPTVEYMGLEDK